MTETKPEEHPWLERLRKLLDKAEGLTKLAEDAKPETPEQIEEVSGWIKEAEALRERAFELSARYGIEGALLRQRDSRNREAVINIVLTVGKPYSYQIILAWLVFKNSGCDGVRLSGDPKVFSTGRETKTAPKLHAFGFKSDIERAQMLYTSLALQAAREAVVGYRIYVENFEPYACEVCDSQQFRELQYDKGWSRCQDCGYEVSTSKVRLKPDRRPTWYRSFWNGWVVALEPRLELLSKVAEKQAGIDLDASPASTAVALRNRDLEVRRSRDQAYPKTHRTRRTGTTHGSGYQAGKEAGRRADIGHDRIGAKRKEVE